MAVNLSPIWGAGAQLFDNSGNVLSGGKIYTYAAGTTTPATTYTSLSGVTANSNPIILNSAGRVPYEIWITAGLSYKFVLKDSNDVLIATYDNLIGINSNTHILQEIQTATAGQTSFVLQDITYKPNINNLSVYVDGVNQYGPNAQYAYVESNSTTVTFTSGLHEGALVKFTTAIPVSSGTFSNDAFDIIYQPPFTGSVGTTVGVKLSETVNVEDFGAIGDGVTNDTAAFQAAIDYLYSVGGGTVLFTSRYLIDSNLTVKDYVTLRGPLGLPDELLPGTQADYQNKNGVLIVNSAATITTKNGSAVSHCVIIRKGLNLPFSDAAAASTGLLGFAGTALTAGGAGCYFHHLLILGFNLAIYSTGNERVRCEYVQGDCTNGIDIRACYDISYVENCHFWPFTTVHQTWTTNTLLRRSGNAYVFSDVGDWNKVTNCFSYGYFRGFRLNNVNSMTFVSCGADNTSVLGVGDYTNSLGFLVEGASKDTSFIGCQAAAQETGFQITSSVDHRHTELVDCDMWGNSVRGVLINSGDVRIIGGVIRDTATGVFVNNTVSRVFLSNIRFSDCSNKPIGFNVSNSTTFIENNDYYGLSDGTPIIANASNWPLQSVASADPLNLPVNGDTFFVTGTTNFGNLLSGWRERKVTLVFTDALTVNNGGASPNGMYLSGGVNFNAVANSTLTLVHTGTNWYEIGRKA